MWTSIQLGAREHYAIPRALKRLGALRRLLTDAWLQPGSPLGLLNRNLRERFHPELAETPVSAWTTGLTAFELAARTRRVEGWDVTIARNEWFQNHVVRALKGQGRGQAAGTETLFSYSYTALEPFRVARERGWRTVLGQIDPGLTEERIVADLTARWPQYATSWQPAPTDYWANWREECSLADVILVNSDWSREALLSEGVPREKIAVVPLAYERGAGSGEQGARPRPPMSVFSQQRPLRVLFLGQAIVRKGIHDLVGAARMLQGEPIHVDVVGAHGGLPDDLPGNMTFHGPVARSQVARWYRQADLFVLPTYSDGFALTQLEAMSYGLPVIATPNCGAVVEPGRNGWIINAGAPEKLAGALCEAINRPDLLSEMSREATRRTDDFSLESLCNYLARLETA
jgi:glycosyltransferase involved in cell wall biosynthesis